MKKLIRKILLETDNSKSNLQKLLDRFKMDFPEELRDKVEIIEKFVVDYIRDNNFTVNNMNIPFEFILRLQF